MTSSEKMTQVEPEPDEKSEDVIYSNDILITKMFLEEKQALINDLEKRLEEQQMESDFIQKRRDMAHQEELKEINGRYTEEITRLKAQIQDLESESVQKEEKFFEFIKKIKKEHVGALQNLEAHYNSKLIGEYESYNKLQQLLEKTTADFETRLTAADNERSKSIDELVQYYDGKIKDKDDALELAFDEARQQLTEGEEMKKQIEEDADQEILDLSTGYEKKLKQEREINKKLKGEAGIMRKKFITMQKEIEDLKGEAGRLINEGSKMKSVIQMSEKEISTLRKDILDRDSHVHDKEKVIFDLKKTNNELEKYKFVLDHKIKELKKNIEPKDREVSYLKSQNSDMESELEKTISSRNGIELQVSELVNKLRITESEYQKEKRARWRLSVLVFRIRAQLSRGMSNLSDHKLLKNIIKSTYNKYGQTVRVGKPHSSEQEAVCELVKQKNHIEMSLHSIKKQMERDVQFSKNDQMKIMNENMLLSYEINNLRKELKNCRDRINAFETNLGLNQSGGMPEMTEMRLKLQVALQDRDALNLKHGKEIEDKTNLIKAQQSEIDKLNSQMIDIQQKLNEFHLHQL